MARPIAHSLMNFAGLAKAQLLGRRAARLWGAVDSTTASLALVLLPTEQKNHESEVAEARDTLGEEAFDTAWQEGKAMTLEQTVAYALQDEPL